MSSWDNGLRVEANVCLFVIGSSFHRHLPRIAVLTAIIYYTFESDRGKRNNPKISKFRFFTYWVENGWKRMKVKSCGVHFFRLLLSRSLSRFVIENVDGLIFRDISFQFFSRKMGEWGKTERLLDFPLSERWFVYSSTCTLF